MATQAPRISTIFAQVQATSDEVQASVNTAMGLVAYSHGPSNYPIAADAMDQALEKAVDLLEGVRTLRSALRKAKPFDS
jgi:hypothetical protein